MRESLTSAVNQVFGGARAGRGGAKPSLTLAAEKASSCMTRCLANHMAVLDMAIAALPVVYQRRYGGKHAWRVEYVRQFVRRRERVLTQLSRLLLSPSFSSSPLSQDKGMGRTFGVKDLARSAPAYKMLAVLISDDLRFVK